MDTAGATTESKAMLDDGEQRDGRDGLGMAPPTPPQVIARPSCTALSQRSHGAEVGLAAAQQDDTDRRKAITCAAGRDWGRADSAFTFRGHASGAAPKAEKKRDGGGNGGVLGPAAPVAAHSDGRAGSAGDLMNLSGSYIDGLQLTWVPAL